MTAIRESTFPESVIDITTPELTPTPVSRKSVSRPWRLSLLCFAVVGVAQLMPQAASAEPRTGPTKYKCAWKNEYVCTAAPGGGGKLSNCHTERVWDCVAVSGPGSLPNTSGGKGGLGSGPVHVGSLPTGPSSPAPGGRPVITSPVGVRPVITNPGGLRPITANPVGVRPVVTSPVGAGQRSAPTVRPAGPVRVGSVPSISAPRSLRSPVMAPPSSRVAGMVRR